jgi:ATP adenylyltransferase
MDPENPRCDFCAIPHSRIILRNSHAYAILDGFPVTPLHTLIIPTRHVEDCFDLTQAELSACYELLRYSRDRIVGQDSTIAGFNIGINVGAAAGQTVFHCHIHLIPRRTGDVADPRGGVRHVIPYGGA